ncbi:hypothetical protein [Schauerella aestuarii]|uniref:hypothetical protein n=1 Tax=Schauerella aestuarii TaxID=2511204 RepID=UPI001925C568|nr:hypothetical protein [Achromobacter aestuarii]MYZ44211.1 hypothetical protein [Achromobacter aestuarii]
MDIKIKWGFEDDSRTLDPEMTAIKAGRTFKNVDSKYAHDLIGRGLAEEVKPAAKVEAKPAANKQTGPKENK